MDYNNKKFKPVSVSANGEVTDKVLFEYKQQGKILSCEYSGGTIVKGQLIGVVDKHGRIDMRYQQLNFHGELMTGTCVSEPEILENGKIRLYETWQWTSGDKTNGTSILEEV